MLKYVFFRVRMFVLDIYVMLGILEYDIIYLGKFL